MRTWGEAAGSTGSAQVSGVTSHPEPYGIVPAFPDPSDKVVDRSDLHGKMERLLRCCEDTVFGVLEGTSYHEVTSDTWFRRFSAFRWTTHEVRPGHHGGHRRTGLP